jgi:hypothetical protein
LPPTLHLLAFTAGAITQNYKTLAAATTILCRRRHTHKHDIKTYNPSVASAVVVLFHRCRRRHDTTPTKAIASAI